MARGTCGLQGGTWLLNSKGRGRPNSLMCSFSSHFSHGPVSTWHNLRSSEWKDLNWENYSKYKAIDNHVWHLLTQWLMGEGPDHYEWCHPWIGGLGNYIEAEWARSEEEASVSSVLHSLCSVPASRSLPHLSSFPDFFQWRTVIGKCKINKPCPLQVALDHGASSQQ